MLFVRFCNQKVDEVGGVVLTLSLHHLDQFSLSLLVNSQSHDLCSIPVRFDLLKATQYAAWSRLA